MFLALILSILAVAPQQAIPDPSSGIMQYIQAMIDSLKGGNYRMLAAMLIVGFIFICRAALSKVGWKWVGTDRGGTVVALGTGLLSYIAAGLANGAKIDAWLFIDGIMAGVTAIGGYTAIKKLFGADSSAPQSQPEPAPAPAPAPQPPTSGSAA